MEDNRGTTLVIGGGIAGLYAARELSRAGVHVELVEKGGFLGGHAIGFGCKATDRCLECGACTVEQVLADVVADPNIRTWLNTTMEHLDRGGGFTARLRTAGVGIDPETCTDCGLCYEKHGAEGVVLRGFSRSNRPLYAVDVERYMCLADEGGDACTLSPTDCPEGAVVVAGEDRTVEIAADAVILATGYTPFDAENKPHFGYGRIPNVITGLDAENMLRDRGGLVRPTDGGAPARQAFIQCVGSRDEGIGNPWCSRVCCAYALRTAQKAAHGNPECETTVFYMDIQSVGKGFPSFYEKCRQDMRFVRNIPVEVHAAPEDRLSIRFSDPETGMPTVEEFDLLVLSVGITPSAANPDLASMAGADVDDNGFLAAGGDSPDRSSTRTPGVFVAGTAAGPCGIAASMAHAGEAAAMALRHIGGAR
ncbi:MAG: FAD-dependent oxidoreductase [Desulfatibacillaceae bacterium]